MSLAEMNISDCRKIQTKEKTLKSSRFEMKKNANTETHTRRPTINRIKTNKTKGNGEGWIVKAKLIGINLPHNRYQHMLIFCFPCATLSLWNEEKTNISCKLLSNVCVRLHVWMSMRAWVCMYVCGVQPFLGRTFAVFIDMLTNMRTGKKGISRPSQAKVSKH